MGAGVLAADALDDYGGALAELPSETVMKLDAVLPPHWSRANPVDILGDAKRERYESALEVMPVDPGSDAVLVMNCPTALADSPEAAKAVLAACGKKDPPRSASRTSPRRRRGEGLHRALTGAD